MVCGAFLIWKMLQAFSFGLSPFETLEVSPLSFWLIPLHGVPGGWKCFQLREKLNFWITLDTPPFCAYNRHEAKQSKRIYSRKRPLGTPSPIGLFLLSFFGLSICTAWQKNRPGIRIFSSTYQSTMKKDPMPRAETLGNSESLVPEKR